MKKEKWFSRLFLASILTVGTVVTGYKLVNRNSLSSLRNNGESTSYKIVLNKDNYATVAEIGTFNNPISGDKLATRKTELGNDIVFQFCSGKGVTNNDGDSTPSKFCQMPALQYGWVTNKSPLHGITNIKVTVQQSSALFRIDFSKNHTLEDYYYSQDPKPTYIDFRSEEYSGSTTYNLNFDGSYNYFRLQNLSGALSLASLEISYTCSSASPTRGTLRTDATPIDISPVAVSLGGTITVDYRYANPSKDASNGVSLFLGSDSTHRFGNYKLLKDGLNGTYPGVTSQILDDEYIRLTFDISLLETVRSGEIAPTNITQLSFLFFEASGGVYFDVEVKPDYRGVLCKNQDATLSLGSHTVSKGGTIIIDYMFVDPAKDSGNGISLFLGSDTTNRFGNYKLRNYGLESTYEGVSTELLSDGYCRLTFDISKLNTVRSGENAPTVITKVMFKWFEVNYGAYFDIPSTPKPTTFKMTGTEFRIANFTDIHVNDEELLGPNGTVSKTIEYGISSINPDILIFSGDLAGSSSDLDYLFPYLDSFEIPYFVILGNHDHEGSLGYDTIAQHLNLSEYGYIEKGPTSLNSQGNYTIKIENSDGDLVHGLIMMDTGNKYTIEDESNVEYLDHEKISGVKYGSYNSKSTYCDGAGDKAWDGIRGVQVDWFEETATKLGVETTLICHAGFNEYVKAFEQYQDAVNKKDSTAIAACAPIGQCNMGEQVCGTVENTGLFNKIKAVGTKNVICGHDHLNDFSLLYQGVRLTYALKTGEGSYWKDDGTRCGCTELTINNSGETSLNQIYYNPLV